MKLLNVCSEIMDNTDKIFMTKLDNCEVYLYAATDWTNYNDEIEESFEESNIYPTIIMKSTEDHIEDKVTINQITMSWDWKETNEDSLHEAFTN